MDDLFHLWRTGNAEQDHLGALGRVRRVARLARAALDQILDRHTVLVAEHGRLEPLFDEVLGHAVAHHADADEADLHRLLAARSRSIEYLFFFLKK